MIRSTRRRDSEEVEEALSLPSCTEAQATLCVPRYTTSVSISAEDAPVNLGGVAGDVLDVRAAPTQEAHGSHARQPLDAAIVHVAAHMHVVSSISASRTKRRPRLTFNESQSRGRAIRCQT